MNNELYLFGAVGDSIGDFDSTSFDEKTVAAALSEIPSAKPLDVYVNSPGGSVDSALAIKALLEARKGTVNVIVAGLCASAATVIACAANAHVIMKRGSLYMIHNAASLAYGNQHDLAKAAETVEKVSENIASIYRARTGMGHKRITDLMDEETYLDADEAVRLGFADEVDEGQPVTASLISQNHVAVGGCVFAVDPAVFRGLEKKFEVNSMISDKETVNDAQKAAAPEPVMTLEALQEKYPELCAAIAENAKKDAVLAEKARIKALEELRTDENSGVIAKAMFETGETAETVALALCRAQAQKAREAAAQADAKAAAAAKDAEALGAQLAKVTDPASGTAPADADQSAKDAFIAAVRDNINSNVSSEVK